MITNSSPSPSSFNPAWVWEWGGDTLRVLVMTGSSAGPDTCESASARTACTWAGWAATQAASSSSFATRKWAGQPHRPCMRRTRWTFAGEGIGRRGAGGEGGGSGEKSGNEKRNTKRSSLISPAKHAASARPRPAVIAAHKLKSQVTSFSMHFAICVLIDIKFLDGKIYQVFPLFSVENRSFASPFFPLKSLH